MSGTAAEVGRLDALAQAALVTAGDVKPTELVEWAIERAEALNPALNAIITPMYDRARDAATSVDPAAPLAGVPMLLKDLIAEIEGTPFAEGSRFVDGYVSSFTSELVTRHERAGLVHIGKTNTPEFGMAPHCEPRLRGATHNPWSVGHTTSGSSGGSAAAVAAGIVPVAHANDAGGSIRYPASCCALFGLKPTRARTPIGPEYSQPLGGAGIEHVLTRSVRDSAAVLDATAGPAVGDPYRAPPAARPFVAEVGAPTGRLRIAVSRQTAEGTANHPDCIAAVDATVTLLEALGHEVIEREFVVPGDAGGAIGTLINAGTSWILRYWEDKLGRRAEPGELEPATQAMASAGAGTSAADYMQAIEALGRFSRTVAAGFADIDLMLCSTVTAPPLPLGVMSAGTEEAPFAGLAQAGEMIRNAGVIANITGNPAMSVPLFWNDDGLPIGSHFLAPFGDEATLIRLASQLEAAQPWADKWPTVSVAMN